MDASAGALASPGAMIDLHSHILPGIDDGAPDLEASLAMGRAAVGGGVEAIVATPHISGRYQNDPSVLGAQVERLQRALEDAAVSLTVHQGAEIAHSMFHDLSDEGLQAATLGNTGNWLL